MLALKFRLLREWWDEEQLSYLLGKAVESTIKLMGSLVVCICHLINSIFHHHVCFQSNYFRSKISTDLIFMLERFGTKHLFYNRIIMCLSVYLEYILCHYLLSNPCQYILS
jgi:hypothetical protein